MTRMARSPQRPHTLRTRILSSPLAAGLTAPFGPRSLAALLHALLVLPLAVLGLVLVPAGLALGAVLSWTTLGPWLIALTVRGALLLGDLQRALARALLGVRIEPAARRRGPGAFGWRRAVLGDRAGWRAVACALFAPLTAALPLAAAVVAYVYGLLLFLHPVLKHWNFLTLHDRDGSVRRVSLQIADVQFDSWPRWIVVVVAGVLLLTLAPWLMRKAGVPHLLLLRGLLGPNAAATRIRTLEVTRAQAVDDAAATLRRIERDLHDGTQARLVGLGMHLTLIRELITKGAEQDRLLAVVETAQGNAKQAVADLRDLVRGIHPPVLDQGLNTALATLAADAPLPVMVGTEIGRRPSPALETIAYFCAAELLANVVKHSGASRATIDVVTDRGKRANRARAKAKENAEREKAEQENAEREKAGRGGRAGREGEGGTAEVVGQAGLGEGGGGEARDRGGKGDGGAIGSGCGGRGAWAAGDDCADDALWLSVWDDGRGGAEIGAGSGLTGLLARIRTVDGTLTCDSPVGGPTVVAVRLPYPPHE